MKERDRKKANEQPPREVLGNLALRSYPTDIYTSRQAPLSRQASALVELSKSRKIQSGNLDEALKEITETAAHTLEVPRVGVWLYDKDHTEIFCVDQYCADTGQHSKGTRLHANSYPNYFKALEEARTIAADNALTDSRTREFKEGYLIPLRINSLLDAPIRMAGQLVGVVCHEHVGSERQWALDERQFAGSIADFVCMAIESSERSKAEEAMRASQERLKSLLENVPDIILKIDREGRILYINHTEPQYDPESVIGMDAIGYVKEDHRDLFRSVLMRAFETRQPQDYELDSVAGRNYSSRLIPMASPGDADTCLLIATDVTDRRRAEHDRGVLEVQLQHAQKLECLGMLAGGIAHDFNNLLVGILGNTSLVMESKELEPPLRHRLNTVKKTAQRASELINQLLAYSGKSTSVKVPVDISALAEELRELLESSISKKVKLNLELAQGLPSVKGDPTQLRQVLMNLIVNAAEACEENHGTVEIRTGRINATEEILGGMIFGEHLSVGGYIILEVRDSGRGMSEEVIKNIFDPFFTTKFAGRGLGLAAVLGIVRSHNGAIRVESVQGSGSQFTILIPISSDVEDDESLADAANAKRLATKGSILVIDDDPIVREVTESILKIYGFSVFAADSGETGLRIYSENQDSIQAVVVDMTMPDMSGDEVFTQLRKSAPSIPVLILSGYTEEYIPESPSKTKNYAFLQKPYLPDALITKLSEIIPPLP